MNSELEENRELADNRLVELQKLQQDLNCVQQDNSDMKVAFHFAHNYRVTSMTYSHSTTIFFCFLCTVGHIVFSRLIPSVIWANRVNLRGIFILGLSYSAPETIGEKALIQHLVVINISLSCSSLLFPFSPFPTQTELCSRAESVVKETAEYRCLQSQFSVLYNESLILKGQLDETRARLNTTRTARLRQLEHMEVRVCV